MVACCNGHGIDEQLKFEVCTGGDGDVDDVQETFTTLFLIPYGMLFQQAQQPIPGQTAGQAAGFSRSTSGCGAMGKRSPGRSLWRMLKR